MEMPVSKQTTSQLSLLRERIKSKYKHYNASDKTRYPEFEYNTNRTNYEPLRESFEEEFFIRRGFDRQLKTIHIPSTATLAQLFTEQDYIPSLKIWNTCWSYVEDNIPEKPLEKAPTQTAFTSPPIVANLAQRRSWLRNRSQWLLLGGVGLVAGGFIGFTIRPYLSPSVFQKTELSIKTEASRTRLLISNPTTKSRVPPTFIICGRANPKETVWLVTHFEGTDMYWVQFPALSSDKGIWFTAIDIRGAGFDKMGKKHEVRAFVNPVNELRVSEVLLTWPEAERSTAIVEVVMDPTRSTRDYAD